MDNDSGLGLTERAAVYELPVRCSLLAGFVLLLGPEYPVWIDCHAKTFIRSPDMPSSCDARNAAKPAWLYDWIGKVPELYTICSLSSRSQLIQGRAE